ncbi:MAG TPA: tetratricopeptide repeat protein, partial [Bryobacteraceae bacterium]|nr:tetratricopeptide repeat protein [Bryobacteraceae bacterium]
MGNAAQLLRLFSRPTAAFSAILDQGSLLFATSAVIIVSLLLELSLQHALSLSLAFVPLLGLAVVYVPSTLLITNLIARLGGLSLVFQRDYSSLLTCAAMAWTAANLPIALAGWFLPLPIVGGVAIVAYLYFAVLMVFAVRTVFGTETGTAAGVVSVSWVPLVAAPFLWGPLRFILSWLTSPFLLFFIFYYLRGEFVNLGAGLRRRQHFHRMLEAATVNPHDGDAQYQLGLIHQQRRQYTEAIRRFKNAVTIDSGQTDAHFQLGRIALQQGRLNEALEHFQTVYVQDPKHNSNEILRELGALYAAAGQYQDALQQLELYIERRPYDPEGLYYNGLALEKTGDLTRAREMYGRAIEA